MVHLISCRWSLITGVICCVRVCSVNRKILSNRCGVVFTGTGSTGLDGVPTPFAGITIGLGARVVWSPEWAITQSDALQKIQPTKTGTGAISITPRSTLILNGRNIIIKSLVLDGCLVVNACDGASVTIDCGAQPIVNAGWQFKENGTGSGGGGAGSAAGAAPVQITPAYAIRGYTLNKIEAVEANYPSGGQFLFTGPPKHAHH